MALPPILYGTPASGDLSGAYPNPVIADGAVLRKHIAVGAVGADEIADNTITAIHLVVGSTLGQVITDPINIASGVVTPAHMAALASYVRTQGNQSISGIKSFERLVLFRWPIQPYDVTNKHYVDSMILSGGGANPNLESYASGTRTLEITIQNNATILTNYASGIGTLAGLTQINLTANNNTTSGLITTVQSLQLYASGIETLRRAMVSTGSNPELESYASGIETMRRQMGTVPVNVTGDSVKATLTQTNSFVPFDCLYYDGTYKLAQANVVATADALGVVESVSGNGFTIVYDGKLDIASGSIIPGVQYFLSHADAGELITDDPAVYGYISKPILTSITNTIGVVNIQRGILGDVASGMQTFRLDAIEAYSSGIETMRRSMVSTGTNPELEGYASGIETMRRAMTTGGTSTLSTNNYARGYIDGFITTPYTTSGVSVASGAARDDANSTNIILSTPIIKKITGVWVAGSLQNGIDSGNRAASTWYYIHSIVSGNATDELFSISSTSPTLPSGYTASRRIASVRTDSIGYIVPYKQFGDTFEFYTGINDFNGSAPTVSTDLTLTVPPNTVALVRGGIDCTDGSVKYYYLSEKTLISNLQYVMSSTNGATLTYYPMAGVRTNGSSVVNHLAQAINMVATIVTNGWIDPRGKDS